MTTTTTTTTMRAARVRATAVATPTRRGRAGRAVAARATPRACADADDVVSRRAALRATLAVVVGARALDGREAMAMFNSDLDKPIEDGPRAIAVVLAARLALGDVSRQNDEFRDTCEAPVFACDLSQLNVKTSSRVSGPLRRALPTLSEVYGADPYAVDDVLRSVSTLEAIFKANNARVKVDFKGGPEMIGLIERGLDDLFRDLPPDAVEAGRAILDGCDLTVNAAADGDLECRIARAVAQKARPTGGQS